MSRARERIEAAYARLHAIPGFQARANQSQLSWLLADCIESDTSGAFEAPTGLGKSLAALIPAIAYGLEGKRIVIATYTNLLAEQYWRKDLPLAIGLFDGEPPRCQFLIGRQRYACLTEMDAHRDLPLEKFRTEAELGIESEFRSIAGFRGPDAAKAWSAISAPPVCPGRLCPHFQPCFYYRARRGAEKAEIVVTNHSVVLQDAVLRRVSQDETGLLGEVDFIVVDEAHDFAQAAAGALEFELSDGSIAAIAGLAARMEQTMIPLAAKAGMARDWGEVCQELYRALENGRRRLRDLGVRFGKPGILAATPDDILDAPPVKEIRAAESVDASRDLASDIASDISDFVRKAQSELEAWVATGEVTPAEAEEAREATRNYGMFLREFAAQCRHLFAPRGVSVSYGRLSRDSAMLRQDTIDLSRPLRELLWDVVPTASISATLAVDGSFEFFRRTTGAEPEFEEILPSPFDFETQAACYVPKAGVIPDPSAARREGTEDAYFAAVARELSQIIEWMQGRTLALFHSRREMEEVASRMSLPEDLPVLIQRASGSATVGERFKREVRASLFALRSFWTGFDAPGETLSCVAIVRVPFEVPVEPPQIVRQAWMQSQGRDPFAEYSLANAKMMMRQGVGRLIRTDRDRGLMALLDPRLRTKRYGEAILDNLPPGMRTFDDAADAIGWLGLS
ncbi:MAG: ATP-dependent DNA helicase [Fimbriimonadaceae bacterium]